MTDVEDKPIQAQAPPWPRNSLSVRCRDRPLTQRILIYGINYAPEIAGVGKYSGEIGEFLVARGHEVCVVSTPTIPDGAHWGLLQQGLEPRDRRRGHGLSLPPVSSSRHEGHPAHPGPLTFALSSGPVAITQILRRRPDVVLVVEPTFFAAPAALIAAKLVGAKTVLHVQDLEIDAAFAVGHIGKGGFAAKLAKAFEETTLRFFDQVITISSRMAEKIAEKGVSPSRIDVIRNWVDVERIRPEIGASPYRAELALADDIKVALYSGNIGAKQGLRLIIEAAEQLADRPDILFVIAGDGPMRGAVAAAADRLPNIRLLPFQPEARFSDFLNLADIHLLPQEREAADLLLPSKLGGMLASGKPILVTADPGTELSDFLGPPAN
uniref:WcaI family glycosyltransferase n=1 Tax=Phenylobacterium glaciei TaxID=2803784 RepID=A0A974P6P6_9CAUL|nr:WcaI family glycosyltransferase [Phenylobacterium glaciei]